ncbi:unnamed protein product, partial [Ascophyllum nodosum]
QGEASRGVSCQKIKQEEQDPYRIHLFPRKKTNKKAAEKQNRTKSQTYSIYCIHRFAPASKKLFSPIASCFASRAVNVTLAVVTKYEQGWRKLPEQLWSSSMYVPLGTISEEVDEEAESIFRLVDGPYKLLWLIRWK